MGDLSRVVTVSGTPSGRRDVPFFSGPLAYIDPGILGNLGQALYALALGAITMFITRPWRVIRRLFNRRSSPGE